MKKIIIIMAFLMVISSATLALNVGDYLTEEIFYTLNGEEFNIEQLLGEFIFYDIWATWCPPCIISMVDYQKNIDYFKENDIKLVAVATDRASTVIKNFVTQRNISFKVLHDQQAKVLGWGVVSIPTAFLVAPDGEVLLKKVGYTGFENLQNELSRVLTAYFEREEG